MTDSTRAQLTALLRDCAMTKDVTDLRTLTELFLTQMRVSLYGGKSSLPVLPTFLKPFGTLPHGQSVAVAEVNDREVRVSLVTFREEGAVVTDQDSFPVPGREYPAPLEDLIFAAAELLEPLLDRAKDVALCLPFPVDYDGKGDGVVRSFPGSMKVSDYEDKPLLSILAQELRERGFEDLRLVLVSQSDAALLAARAQLPEEEQKQYRFLGLNWGSSFSGGFVAPGSIVLRWLGIPGDLMLFDADLSSFEQIPFGLADLPKDRDCYAPGEDLLLKAVSTEYLGDTFRLVMIKAAERKLLSFGCSRDILSLTTLDLASVVDFIEDPVGGGTIAHFCREPEDREVGLLVAQAVFDRAARLVCAALSAMLKFIGADRGPRPCIALWGDGVSCPALTDPLAEYLKEFTHQALGYPTATYTSPHMPAIGSAAAALYHR